MFNISQQTIDIECLKCDTKNTVTLKQVKDQETIKCTSCKKNITLIDKDNSTKKSIRDINKAFKSIENTIRKIGK